MISDAQLHHYISKAVARGAISLISEHHTMRLEVAVCDALPYPVVQIERVSFCLTNQTNLNSMLELSNTRRPSIDSI